MSEVASPDQTAARVPRAGDHPGLTTAEVARAQAAGESNYVPRATSRPVTEIIRANVVTVFNAILGTALVAVLLVGDWRDAVFGFVLIFNMAIGVFSELRAKRTLDSVAVLATPESQVVRDGTQQTVPSDDLVTGELVLLGLGDQVPADGSVIEAAGLEVDESILTGEAHPVHKQAGDPLMSGTAVVAGSGAMLVEKVGADSWAQQITAEARKFSLAISEIQESINVVLKAITLALPFVAALLLWSQMRAGDGNWRTAVVFTVAGVIGMIPQGLVLLTSMNFGIAAATLSRRGVLIQELPAVEILARVDQLCLDKTGTITTGKIRGKTLEFPADLGDETRDEALAVLYESTAGASTPSAVAIQELLEELSVTAGPDCNSEEIPFSSTRKWSALHGADIGTWVLGAPEIILQAAAEDGADTSWAEKIVAEASAAGNRTLALARSEESPPEEGLPKGLQPVLVGVLEEDIRPDAAETIDYFRSQGVRVRVVSGDAPATVAAIAKEINLGRGGKLKVVDARELPRVDTAAFDKAAYGVDVFGRVTPEQKQALVRSFQRRGHTVAMTGDGVNDALALKEADLGIAMGNGAPATKAVSRLVLLNNEFSVLPGVVSEGRRIIANMERVSSVFLAKTTYVFLLVVAVSAFGWLYPFLPRQLTFIAALTIGTPAFFLALGPTSQRYRPGFLRRTLWLAVPSGIILGATALAVYLIIGEGTIPAQSGATLALIIGALWLLGVTARRFNAWRITLLGTMAAGALLGVMIPFVRNFFALEWPSPFEWLLIVSAGVLASVLIEINYRYIKRFTKDPEENL